MGEFCIHCQAAREEIAELRRALGLSGKLTDQRAIERRFKLTRSEAKITQALYDAAGRMVPHFTLESVGMSEDASPGTLKVHVCRIRSKIGADSIETGEGGYAMTPVGRALIYTALKTREAA